ncbi:MAG TPA: transcription termination/antitermination protein NusG [Isosphaeraceae bacterium]|jgi:transcriptional antiterminator NusG|nr:transcription termination/antitermination protein NusG [Isosphaeraceae bacterium]
MNDPTPPNTQPDPGHDHGLEGHPADASPSVGPSNLFEVEESAPDGGLPAGQGGLPEAHADLREAEEQPDVADDEDDDPGDEVEDAPPDVAEEPSNGSLDAATADDDDEPPPTLTWYVLKVQSGREDTIRDALERRVKIQGLGRYFGRIVVPTEKITEIRNNKKRVVTRKSYPGYIMVEMELNEKTWFTVRETPGVGDFVGGARGSNAEPWKHATPMTGVEVDQMLGQATAREEKGPQIRIKVERGDRVKIKEGPFENFEGTVEEVIEARGVVKVMLIIFNRPTPVDLEYWQVERI